MISQRNCDDGNPQSEKSMPPLTAGAKKNIGEKTE